MVLFKSAIKQIIKQEWLKFTFQSGDIQIKKKSDDTMLYVLFTFQSGDIQIEIKPHEFVATVTFTFQSGDIQI